jgi:hypothetical protein
LEVGSVVLYLWRERGFIDNIEVEFCEFCNFEPSSPVTVTPSHKKNT